MPYFRGYSRFLCTFASCTTPDCGSNRGGLYSVDRSRHIGIHRFIYRQPLKVFSAHSFQNQPELWRIVAQSNRRQDIQNQICHSHRKGDGKRTHIRKQYHRQKTDGVRQPMGKHTLITFHNEFLYICRTFGICQTFLLKPPMPPSSQTLSFHLRTFSLRYSRVSHSDTL